MTAVTKLVCTVQSASRGEGNLIINVKYYCEKNQVVISININTRATDCHDHHAPYGRRHVVLSAVSLASMHASPAKLALASM